MSIIYEALKKVESGKLSGVTQIGNLSSGHNNKAAAPSGVKTVFKALIAVCLVGTVLVASGAYFSTRNIPSQNAKEHLKAGETIGSDNRRENSTTPVVVAAANKRAGVESAASPGPVISAPGLSAYSLQGIVYDEDSPFAIINGKTLRKSDAIGDFVVVDIAPTIVTLKNPKDNEELILSF